MEKKKLRMITRFEGWETGFNDGTVEGEVLAEEPLG